MGLRPCLGPKAVETGNAGFDTVTLEPEAVNTGTEAFLIGSKAVKLRSDATNTGPEASRELCSRLRCRLRMG